MSLRLQLEQVNFRVGAHHILQSVDFHMESGEIVALLGDNGAGKSSLIKIISGFHRPSSGLMKWEGECVDISTFTPQKARDLGIQTVYQHLSLVDQLSIVRNFFLGRELQHRRFGWPCLDKVLMREIVKLQLSQMKIARKLDPETPVAYLSGGERQCLAIARAHYFGAKLLILDEPTSALSLNQTQEVLHLIAQASEKGLSVILITHNLHHIRDLVDRVCIMSRGRIVARLESPVCEQTCESWLRGESVVRV